MPAPQDSGAQAGGAEHRDWQASDITVTEPNVIRRAVAAAAIGNVTEWFDFGVYAYLESTIEEVFFHGASPAVKTMGTLGIFAVSFLVRPFGGLFFGPLGDRIGRTRVLSLTVIMMAIGTFCIGVIPDYQQVGAIAPMLMLLCRLVQGFSTGGEYGGAMTFIAEYAPDKRRGFLGSWLEFGTCTGYALGAALALVITSSLPTEDVYSWGWRIPFLVAGPLGVIGLYLRSKLEETPAFKQIAEESEGREGNQTLAAFREIFVQHWRPMLLCGGLVLAFNVTNYMLTTYMPTYLDTTLPQAGQQTIGSTLSQLLQIFVLLAIMLVITFLGRLSDRIGRRKVVFAGCLALILLSYPSIQLIQGGTGGSVFGGLLLMGLMLVCFNSTMPSTLPALFPTEIRYGGLSIAFNIAVSLFGGTTAAVCGGLVILTGDLDMPAFYLMAAGVIGAVAMYFTPESAGRRLPGSAPSAANEEEAREMASTMVGQR